MKTVQVEIPAELVQAMREWEAAAVTLQEARKALEVAEERHNKARIAVSKLRSEFYGSIDRRVSELALPGEEG